MARYRPRSRASSRKSDIFFWVMGSPICTADRGDDSSRARDEKVAPWMPSRPMRPPTITARSPARGSASQAGAPSRLAGMMPPVPQNTSGLPTKLGSNSTAPATVGMPDWLPPSTMPRCTPSSTARGGSRPLGTSSIRGGAKHSTLVLKIGRAPRPVPMMSRFTPTIPVMAPPYGSSADGELWVSALKQSRVSASNSITPELSWNTERRKPSPGSTSCVVARMQRSNRERMVSLRPPSW